MMLGATTNFSAGPISRKSWFLFSLGVSTILVFAASTFAQTQGERGFQQTSTPTAVHTGRRFVMVIGIDQYKGWPRLTNAASDATGFARELKDKLGFVEAAAPLLNQDATKQAIQHLVDDVLYRTLKSDDELVLFFAGHGTTRTDTIGGKEVETGFLVPVEARGPGQEEEYSDYLQVDQFLESVGRLPARHVLVILDACHSGFALGRAMESMRGDVRYREDVAGRVSRKVITSARRNQSATDNGPIPNHSLFTGVLIDGLNSGAADLDGDGVVTSSELGLYLQQTVGRYSESAQTPDFGSFYLDDRGELVLPVGNANSAVARKSDQSRRAVALLGFKNLSGRSDQAWLSTALAEMLTTELGAGDKLRTISGENIARMKRDLALADADSLSPDTLGQVYRVLGSDLVVLGSYLDVGGQLRVDIRVQDATSGETIASVTSSGSESGIFDLVSRLGGELRTKCGGGEISQSEAGVLANAHPSQTDALRYYAEGLSRLRNLDARGARESLQKAVAADPKYAPAHAALAEAWSRLGFDERAKGEAKLAYESSKSLPRKDGLLIEARFQESSGDWDRATEIYKSLWTYFDDLEYGLYLVDAQVAAGKATDAMTTIRALRNLPRPMRDDPRIDLAEAGAAEALSDFKREIETASQSVERAKRGGQRALEAQAFWMQCSAYRSLTDFQNAQEAGAHARETYSSIEDNLGVARSLTCLGNVATDKGDYQTARQMHEQALALVTELGAQEDITGALINLGKVFLLQNDNREATKDFQKALSTALEIADKQDALIAENNLGDLFVQQGDFDSANEMYSRSLSTATELGDGANQVIAMVNLGETAFLRGELAQARTRIESAVNKAKELGTKSFEGIALAINGDILAAQGDTSASEKKYRESLALCEQVQEKSCVANALLSLANWNVENAHATEAEGLARRALQEFEAEKDVNQQTSAHDVLAQALMAEGKFPDAQMEIERARGLDAHDQATILSRAITSGRILAHLGKYDDAIEELQTAIDHGKETHMQRWEMEALLAMGEVRIQAGSVAKGQELLTVVQREAADRGYSGIARKAGILASSKAPAKAVLAGGN